MKRLKQLHYLSWDHQKALKEAFNINKFIDTLSEIDVIKKKNFVLEFYEKDLLLHFHSEEECLLPRLLLNRNSETYLINKTLEDHILIHSLIILLKREKETQKIRQILKEFAEALNQHIRFEERQLFEFSQQILSENDLSEFEREISLKYGDKYKNSSCSLPEI